MTEVGDNSKDEQAKALEVARYVREQLTSHNFVFTSPDTTNVQAMLFKGTSFEISVAIFCGSSYITVHASLPVIFPESCHSKILPVLNAKSVSQPIGSYELNLQASKVSYKIGLPIPPLPNSELLLRAVVVSVSQVDSVGPELVKLSQS